LNPKTPQKAAGILAEPPESEPKPNAVPFEATIAPSPPEDPPQVNLLL
jgi:hypothetical protein